MAVILPGLGWTGGDIPEGPQPAKPRTFPPKPCARRFRPAERRSIQGLVPYEKAAASSKRIARAEKIERLRRVAPLDARAELRRDPGKPLAYRGGTGEAQLFEPGAQGRQHGPRFIGAIEDRGHRKLGMVAHGKL